MKESDIVVAFMEKVAKGEIIVITGKSGQMIYCSPDNLKKIKEMWVE